MPGLHRVRSCESGFRTEANWRRTGRRCEELHLGPLTRDSVAVYLRRELAADRLPSGLASQLGRLSDDLSGQTCGLVSAGQVVSHGRVARGMRPRDDCRVVLMLWSRLVLMSWYWLVLMRLCW